MCKPFLPATLVFLLTGLSSCNSCSRDDHAPTGTSTYHDTVNTIPGNGDSATERGNAGGHTGERNATPGDLPMPVVYFAGGNKDDTTITLRELETAGGIRVVLPNNTAKPFTVSKWSFNAFYNSELVGHVGVNQYLTDDMRILIAEQGPGDVVIIDDVVARDEEGRLYELADLQLRIVEN